VKLGFDGDKVAQKYVIGVELSKLHTQDNLYHTWKVLCDHTECPIAKYPKKCIHSTCSDCCMIKRTIDSVQVEIIREELALI
jgi:hypothetical protein